MTKKHLTKLYLALTACVVCILVACTPPQEPQNSSSAQLTVTSSVEPELATSQLASPTTLQPDQIGSPTSLTSTPIASPTPPQSTNTATPPPSPSTTPSPTATPTPLPPLELYIVYSTTTESSGVKSSQIWLFDTLSQAKQLLFSTDPGSTIELNDVRWHPSNRSLLYYIQREADRKWALWRFNLDRAQAERITEFFSEDTLGWLANWSTTGQWLSLYAEDHSDEITRVFALLVESETGQVVTSEQLGEWSPVVASQFVFYDPSITHPGRNLLVKSTDSPDTVQSIALDFVPVDLAWQPSGRNLVVTSDGGASGDSELFSYDFAANTWVALQEPETDIYGPLLKWAPSGEWLAIAYPGHIYVLNQAQLTEMPVLLAEMERPFVETWLEQPDRMIVRSNNILWLLDPSLPNEMRQVLNLQILGLDSASSIDIWGP